MFRLLVSYRCLDSSGSHSFFFLTGPLCIFWTMQRILARSTIWSHLMNRATTVYHGLLTIDMVIINQTSTFLGLIPLKMVAQNKAIFMSSFNGVFQHDI